MTPTLDWLQQAEKHVRLTLEKLRPQLLEAQGNIEHDLKSDKTVVTEMDKLVEARLKAALAEFDAGIPFSGEETGVDFSKPTYWLVDPIDGTESFIRGMPFCTNMVALIDNNEPVLGIIYNFTLGDYYLAVKGHGATCNGHAIHVSDRNVSRAFVTLTGNPKKNPKVEGLAERLRLNGLAYNTLKLTASGYEHALVANGALDARVSFFSMTNPWDHAPGVLLVKEAGGKVGVIGTGEYDFMQSNYIASNPIIFDALMEYMTKELTV